MPKAGFQNVWQAGGKPHKEHRAKPGLRNTGRIPVQDHEETRRCASVVVSCLYNLVVVTSR